MSFDERESSALPPSHAPPSPSMYSPDLQATPMLTGSTFSDESERSEGRPRSHLARPLAVYPHAVQTSNMAPFAPSARKRNSLQSLASIAHLQHLYARHGLTSKVRPNVVGSAQPALGPAASQQTLLVDDLPPTPSIPPYHNTHVYPETRTVVLPNRQTLRREAIQAWNECSQRWLLTGQLQKRGDVLYIDKCGDKGGDLASMLIMTRATIYCVRRYLLALPPGLLGDEKAKTLRKKDSYRRPSSFFCFPRLSGYGQSLGSTTTSWQQSTTTESTSPLTLLKHRSESNLRGKLYSTAAPPSQPTLTPSIVSITPVRRAALEVLVQLKQRERSCSQTLGTDEDDSVDMSVGHTTWASETEETPVALEGLYVAVQDMQGEQASVLHYLETVQAVFEQIDQACENSQVDVVWAEGASTCIRVVSPWSSYDGCHLEGALEIIEHFSLADGGTPFSMLHNSTQATLEALSDGTLLCHVFNAAVKASRKPWGHINLDDVCVFGTQAGPHPGWTFRKRQNLTVWAAALKARYSISTADFAPALVARGSQTDDTWMEMLQSIVCQWAQAVASEERRAMEVR